MSINREKFDKFYEFEMMHGQLRLFKNGKKSYPNWGKKIYLTYDKMPSNIEEAEELVKAGLVDKTTLEEMYKELIVMSDTEIIEKREQIDIRSYNYLQAIYNNLGFLYIDIDKKEIDKKYFIKKIKMDMFDNADLFKVDDKYIIEFGSFCPPDDYSLTQIYLSKEPRDNYFSTIDKIDKATDILKQLYSYNKDKNIEGTLFNCRTCNKPTHWLNNEYNFAIKVDMLSNLECCM
ncbi:hypothetical protein [Cetobacterium sp.]|uniref:hypothetical protein n=1 Tax=Cetobacterium sp. TaxID=2071632 RepID=UPI003F2F8160